MTRNHLPHWEQVGRSYFITFRLADAVPAHLLRRWQEEREIWLSFHPEPRSAEDEQEYHRRFSSRMDRWLDAGHGSCVLREERARKIVVEALRYFEGERHHTFSSVVMPNHVHACVMLHPECVLEKVVSAWKRRSARLINDLRGTRGAVWQADYFDRIIRDGGHFDSVVRYIRNNPAKAKLRDGEFALYESEDARRVP